MIDVFFYGPGNGDGLDWVSFNNQLNGDRARRLGVPANVIVDAQVRAVGRRFNWRGLGQAFVDEKITRRVTRSAVGIGLAVYPVAARSVIANVPSWVWAGKAGSRRAVARAATVRAVVSRAPRRLFVRVVPYLGWAMLAYDLYTITFKGELWGVQLWSED